jgi:hypothetical protein
MRGNTERLLCLSIHIASHLQAIANLVTANRSGRVRVHLAGDLAVVEPLVLQRPLHLLRRGVAVGSRSYRAEEQQGAGKTLHFRFDAQRKFVIQALG